MAVTTTSGVTALFFDGSGSTTGWPDASIVEASTTYNALGTEDVIFCTGTFTVTLIDPSTATKPVSVRNISGAITLATAAGTIEVTSLTVGQSSTLAPRASGWFEI